MILAVVDAHRTFYERKFKRMGFVLTTFNPGGSSIWHRWKDDTTAVLRPATNCVPNYHRGGKQMNADAVIQMYHQHANEDAIGGQRV